MYGVFSTKYYYESDEKYFNHKRRDIDTTFMRHQNYEGALTPNNFYQNLGVLGSASRPVFYIINREIGLQHGYNAFAQYFHASEDLAYFDTRSPFTQINYIQGTTGESALKLNLAAPIKKNLGLGIDVGRLTSRKIAGRTGNRQMDRLSSFYHLAAYFNFLSNNQRYKLFGNSTLVWNTQNENGGYDLRGYKDKNALFDSLEVAQVKLFNSQSFTNVYRNDVKLYQNYRISRDSMLGLFHELAFQRCTTNIFITPNVNRLDSILDRPAYFDSMNTAYSYRYDRLENKLGITGASAHINYVLFIKNRRISSRVLVTGNKLPYDSTYITNITENYAGAELKLKVLKEKVQLGAFVENKLFNTVSGYETALYKTSLKKDYVIDIYASTPFLRFGIMRKATSPTVFQTHLYHNNYRWKNQFDKAVGSSNIYLEAQKQMKRQFVALTIQATNLDNYIYLDSNRSIQTTGKNINLLRVSAITNLALWKFHLDNRIDFASSSNDTIYAVPTYIIAPKVYFGSKFKTLNFNVGLEATYISSFFAQSYHPELNSFGVQARDKTYGKTIVSPFVNGQIGNFSFWMKYAFANEFQERGYFTTPDYTGLPQTFVFGINWLLYE